MKSLIVHVLFIAVFVTACNAQGRLAIVIDRDGPAKMMDRPDPHSNIIDSVKQGEFVKCDSSIGDWYKTIALKWYRSGEQVGGYMHKSNIKIMETLPWKEQQKIILGTLKDIRKFVVERFQWCLSIYDSNSARWKCKEDSLKNIDYSERGFLIMDTKYDPILIYIETYFCRTGDAIVMDKLFSLLWADRGSADEQPAYSLAVCFVCNPSVMLRCLNKIRDKKEFSFFRGEVEFGMQRYFSVDPDTGKSENKEYSRYLNLLEAIK
jgi:hypothetical protein